jgi:6-phospho-beta-glucosidase
MAALVCNSPALITLNAPNYEAIADLEPDDVVEVPCLVSQQRIQPQTVGRLPEATRPGASRQAI